jgi:arabinose-5-phosphate isomerase
MTEGTFGCVGVTDAKGKLIGIVTDGDLRRKMSAELLSRDAADVMTSNPRTIGRDALAAEALNLMTMKTPKITGLFVVEHGTPVGILHIHDLLRAGVA